MAGEVTQEKGRDGVRRAKEWLERTGRVDVFWTVYEAPEMLTVQRADGRKRSFDMGGVIRGGDLANHPFYAEVKKYSTEGDQPTKYGDYLAMCYCLFAAERQKPLEFMWITWHPFSMKKWMRLCTAQEVIDQVAQRKDLWLGADVDVDEDICSDLAERLWLIVLSDQQERLSMSLEMLAALRQQATLGTKP